MQNVNDQMQQLVNANDETKDELENDSIEQKNLSENNLEIKDIWLRWHIKYWLIINLNLK